jgi:hypothetical protein
MGRENEGAEEKMTLDQAVYIIVGADLVMTLVAVAITVWVIRTHPLGRTNK